MARLSGRQVGGARARSIIARPINTPRAVILARSGAGIGRTNHSNKESALCQVKFTEWTRDDRLRHPVFLGIREDKKASEVVREKAS
jgi:ATP-dependent DNA ligase